MNPEDLKRHLQIDYLRIDEEISRMPVYFHEASELAAEASNELLEAEEMIRAVLSQTAARLRTETDDNGKAYTDTRISTMLEAQDEVREARALIVELKLKARKAAILADSLEKKARLLPKAADLVLSAYLTPDHVLDVDARERGSKRYIRPREGIRRPLKETE